MDTVVLKDSILTSMTDQEFFRFCQENPNLRIERNSNLEIVIMSPTSYFIGRINAEILRQLSNWNMQTGRGEVFDSSTGFRLPDKSMLSPDASWIAKERCKVLTRQQINQFAPICPEFIIEIKSKTDYLPDMVKKMSTWINNGTILAWLIDPVEESTYIFTKESIDEIIGFDRKIVAEEPVAGFVLDLSLLKL